MVEFVGGDGVVKEQTDPRVTGANKSITYNKLTSKFGAAFNIWPTTLVKAESRVLSVSDDIS